MRKKQLWTGIAASMGMLVLILDGKTALEGARQGIELCLRTVVPSLFPFFLLFAPSAAPGAAVRGAEGSGVFIGGGVSGRISRGGSEHCGGLPGGAAA